MTSHIDEMRNVFYFDLFGFQEIYNSFLFYFDLVTGKTKKENMNFDGGQTYSSFNFHKSNENENHVLTKLIRLKANLFTLPKIGMDLISKKPKLYKDLLVKIT